MTTEYDDNANQQVMGLYQREILNQKRVGRAYDMATGTISNKPRQIYKPRPDEYRHYQNSNQIMGSGTLMASNDMIGSGYVPPADFENTSMLGNKGMKADSEMQGGRRIGMAKFQKHMEGGNIFDDMWSGIKEVGSDVWDGIKSVGEDIYSGVKDVGEEALKVAPEALSYVAENPELLAGLGKKKRKSKKSKKAKKEEKVEELKEELKGGYWNNLEQKKDIKGRGKAKAKKGKKAMKKQCESKSESESDEEEGLAGGEMPAKLDRKIGGAEIVKAVKIGGKKPVSKWIQHCMAYAKQHKCSYKQAMKDAKASYKK
jgi:hypothetical protein